MIPAASLLRALRAGSVRAAVAASILWVAAASAPGETPLGPSLREGTVIGEIKDGPQGEDVDEFQARLARGESLSVKVSAGGASALVPSLEVVGPDGAVRPVKLRQIRFGKALAVSRMFVDQSGVWRVRVAARLNTFGRYTFTSHVKPGPRARTEVPANGTAAPVETLLTFEAVQGSELFLDVRGKGGAARVVSLTDPDGAEVLVGGEPAVAAAVTRKSRLELRVDALSSGDGLYTARLSTEPGDGVSRATANVTRPRLPRGTIKIGEKEPYMEPRETLLRGVAERSARIFGANFAPGAVVWFGDTPATDDADVSENGTRLDVIPPPGVPGSVVRIGVVNPDGQAFERADFFTYVPPLFLTDLTDRDGNPARGSSPDGGKLVRMRGANFQSGVAAYFGGVEVLPQIRASDEMDCDVPAHGVGFVSVTIEDIYLHEATLPFEFEYKTPPTVAVNPYAPQKTSVAGTEVVLTGTGFSGGDEVLVDGVAVATVVATPTRLQFIAPAGAPKTLKVQLRDRVGTVVDCPDLVRE